MSNTTVQAQSPAFSMLISTPTYQKLINNTIKDPDRARRFVSAIVSAVAVNPELQECNPSTILSGAFLGESLNLSPSPQLGQYYLVPYENRKNGIKYARFQLGYKGYVQLALRSGYYKRLNVIAVKEGELVHWDPLTEYCELSMIQNETQRERAPTFGYLASFEYLNGFTKTIYWSKEKMIAHADRFSPAFSVNATTIKTKNGPVSKVSFADYEAHNYPAKDDWLYSSFWYKQFDAMAFKTMLRQLISKWGVMSIDLQTANNFDDSVLTSDENGQFIQADTAELTPPPEMEGIKAPEAPAEQEDQVSLSDV